MIPDITVRGARDSLHAESGMNAALHFAVVFRDRKPDPYHAVLYARPGGAWVIYWTRARAVVARWQVAE